MVKIHTRIKRKITDNIKRRKVKRPKTFKSEDAAKEYSKKKGIKDFKLVNINLNPLKPKIKIVVKK